MGNRKSGRSGLEPRTDRPAFLIFGWGEFLGRLVFVLSFLGILVLVFMAVTGLWKLF
ncbi:hypothetical protein [Henriciella sp.]|jgi:hypothetical protein|uniref:hypothetical protein n=1 Tax=Henriciella sp. TaxID=1968823 RepID=UPI00260A3BB7|nr:hypothetical protein [Henriciella sp.]|tara:strand:- start:93 stop:263 length:171 start_codon:yes stop_codon:yes gene_type:complete